MTINVNCPPRGLFIGHETENGARALTVDFSAWAAEYSTGTLQILFQRPGTESPYAVVLTRDGTTATWKPSETDLAEAGTGAVQIIYTVGDVRVKTSIIPVMVEPSLGVETDPPEGWTSWIDQLTDLAAVTEQHAASAAESAENAGDSATDAQRYATDAGDAKNAAVAAAEAAAASASHYPQIVNGVWYVWSPSAGAYISTGIDAQGDDGVSPTVEITAIQGGHRVVITDAEGPHTFDVLDGVTPDMSAYRTAADQDEIDDAQDEELNNLKSALNTKAGIIRDTASGSVASFAPDATVPNLLGLSVAVEPIQDLHGYDSPWPAGGGKNKINAPDITLASAGYIYNGAVNIPAGTYTMSLTWSGSGNPSASFGIFDADGNALVSGSHNFPYTFTLSADATSARFYVAASGTYSNIQIEAGSTATAFSPYSNICPISGRESVEVWDDPKHGGLIEWNQLVDAYWVRDTTRGLTTAESGNGYSVSGTVTTAFDYNFVGLTNFIRFHRDGRKYLITVDTATLGDHLWRVGGYSAVALHNGGFMFTQTATADWNNSVGVNIELGETVNDTGIIGVYDLTQMFGSTVADYIYSLEQATAGAGVAYFHNLFPKDYYPYNAGEKTCVSAVNGDPYRHETISLPETVYGGDIGVVSGNGESTMGMVDLGTLNWIYTPTWRANSFYAILPTIKIVSASTKANMLCEQYKVVSASNLYTGSSAAMAQSADGIRVADSRFSDAASFKAAMSGVQLCYELATPTPIPTTPTEISTVEGSNNVFSPDGDVTVEYAADLKTYIDSKIAAAVAAMS